MKRRRVCRERGCDTLLSEYNDEPCCWVHTKPHVFRQRVSMSNAFLGNIPGAYDITAADRRDLERGTG